MLVNVTLTTLAKASGLCSRAAAQFSSIPFCIGIGHFKTEIIFNLMKTEISEQTLFSIITPPFRPGENCVFVCAVEEETQNKTRQSPLLLSKNTYKAQISSAHHLTTKVNVTRQQLVNCAGRKEDDKLF